MSIFVRTALCVFVIAACGARKSDASDQKLRPAYGSGLVAYPDRLIISARQVNPDPRRVTWFVPPTYAIAPRTTGLFYGPRYFVRQAYSGPAQRGRAYNVRRRTL